MDGLRTDYPDLSVSEPRSSSEDGTEKVASEISYSDQKKKYFGTTLLVRNAERAFWFSFTGPATGDPLQALRTD